MVIHETSRKEDEGDGNKTEQNLQERLTIEIVAGKVRMTLYLMGFLRSNLLLLLLLRLHIRVDLISHTICRIIGVFN